MAHQVLTVATAATLGMLFAVSHARGQTCDYSTQLWPYAVPTDFDRSRVETIEIGGLKANVLLPPGYDPEDSETHYPVLYVLHGGGWSEESGPDLYLALTDLIELTASGPGVIVAMPYEGQVGFYADWQDGTQHWETYQFQTVIPYIDTHYHTIPDRAHRAVAGESMGGFGAIHYAARHPDLFAAVGSFSGVLDLAIASPGEEFVPWFPIFAGYGAALCNPSGDGRGAFGDPVTNDVQWHNHNPVDLAGNLGGVSVYAASGNGVPCDAADVSSFPRVYPTFDLFIRPMNQNFDAALVAIGVAHRSEFPACGTHDFPAFNRYLRSFWPQMLAAFGAPPPESFDYRTADPAFSVWKWTFEADPSRAAEFLDVADASPSGVGLTGSGLTTVTTASYFVSGQTVALNGASEPSAIADSAGRITFHVDLGSPHDQQQYTAPARVLEAAGGYFTSRTVRFAD
jgi:S-formylglutathione hydrolase FrmB